MSNICYDHLAFSFKILMIAYISGYKKICLGL